MTVQPGLCRTWSEPKLSNFSRTVSYIFELVLINAAFKAYEFDYCAFKAYEFDYCAFKAYEFDYCYNIVVTDTNTRATRTSRDRVQK